VVEGVEVAEEEVVVIVGGEEVALGVEGVGIIKGRLLIKFHC